MPVQPPAEFTAHLRKVSKLLDKWRADGRSPRRIPDEIWAQAVQVATVHGVGPVASALHLDHAKLKTMVVGKGSQSLVAARSPEAPPSFFELLAPPPCGASLGACIVSCESASGGRMRVEVGQLDVSGLALLVREFVN